MSKEPADLPRNAYVRVIASVTDEHFDGESASLPPRVLEKLLRDVRATAEQRAQRAGRILIDNGRFAGHVDPPTEYADAGLPWLAWEYDTVPGDA